MSANSEIVEAVPVKRRPWFLGREMLAWSVIGLIALATLFIQSCPDHARAADDPDGAQTTAWSSSSPWDAIFQCPLHQAFFLPEEGAAQGS